MIDGDMLEQYQSLVSWSPDGNSFIIHKPTLFEKHVLPEYFQSGGKLKSFMRKVRTAELFSTVVMSQNFLHWPISIYSIIVVFLINFFLTTNHMLLLLTVTPHGLVNYDMQSCINNNNNVATRQSSCIDGGSLNVQFIA